MNFDYSVDLSRGFTPLKFDEAANPNALSPLVLGAPDGPVLRLAVQRSPGKNGPADRCELREPCKVPMALRSWHAFDLRIPPNFPALDARFVAAQVKANNGDSPLLALRIRNRRLFADWRIGALTIEHHDSLPLSVGRWVSIEIEFGPHSALLWIDGRLITAARADFASISDRRYLKIGPYRDNDPVWGAAPAALDFRAIRRSAVIPSFNRRVYDADCSPVECRPGIHPAALARPPAWDGAAAR